MRAGSAEQVVHGGQRHAQGPSWTGCPAKQPMHGLALCLCRVLQRHDAVERLHALETFADPGDEPRQLVTAEQAVQPRHPAATLTLRWPVHSHGVTSTAAMSSVRESWAIARPGTSG